MYKDVFEINVPLKNGHTHEVTVKIEYRFDADGDFECDDIYFQNSSGAWVAFNRNLHRKLGELVELKILDRVYSYKKSDEREYRLARAGL